MVEHSRRGAVDLSVIMMILAFAVGGFFMYWLNGQASLELAEREVLEEIDEAEDEDDLFASATVIMPISLQPDASGHEDQLIRVVGVEVTSTLGQQGFWLDFPQGPFLVSLSDAMLADSVQVTAESSVTVTGTVTAMSESVAAAWVESGRISEGDGLAAGFMTHFIAAEQVDAN